MAQMPRLQRRNFVQDIGVVRVTGGEALLATGRALDGTAGRLDAQAEADKRAAEARFLADTELAERQWAAETSTRPEAMADPAWFEAQAKGRLSGLVEAAPDDRLKAAITRNVGGHFNSEYTGLLNTKARQDRGLAQTSWQASVDVLAGDMGNLAETKGVNSDDYRRVAAQFEEKLRAGLDARFVDDELANLRRETVATEGEARAVGQFATVRAAALLGAGKPLAEARATALQEVEAQLPTEGISDGRRQALRSRVDSRLGEWAAQQQAALTDVREAAQDQIARMTLGYDADPARLEGLARDAARLGAPQLAAGYREAARNQAAITAFAKQPPQVQEAEAQAAEARARPATASAEAARLATTLRRQADENMKKWQDNGLAHAARQMPERIGALAPIDWGNPEATAGVLQQRARQAQVAGNFAGMVVPALTKPEITGLKSMLSNPEVTPTAKASLLSGMARGLGRQIGPVMAQVAQERDLGAVVVAAGLTMDDPQAARDVLEGIDQGRREKGFLPKEQDARGAATGYLGSAFAFNSAAGQGVMQAADALYALNRARKGDRTGEFDKPAYDAALRKVVGEPIRYKGVTVLPVRRGQSEDQFLDTLAAVTPEILGPVPLRAADGTAVTHQMIARGDFRLHSAGDGRYFLERDGQFVTDPGAPGRNYQLNLNLVNLARASVERRDAATRDRRLTTPLPGEDDAP
jgi:hypothetical protein